MEPGSELEPRPVDEPAEATRASPDAGDEADDDSLTPAEKRLLVILGIGGLVVLLIVLAVNMLSGQQSGRANRNDRGGPRPGIVCKRRRYSRSAGRHCADEHPPGEGRPQPRLAHWWAAQLGGAG